MSDPFTWAAILYQEAPRYGASARVRSVGEGAALTLEAALRDALISLPGRSLLRPVGLRVTVAGAIAVDGLNAYQRVLGPLLIDKDMASPVFLHYLKEDFKAAAVAFQDAFARSYGASRVEITEVVRLHIEMDRVVR